MSVQHLRCPNCYSDDVDELLAARISQHIMEQLDSWTELRCFSCDCVYLDAILRNKIEKVFILYYEALPKVCSICGSLDVKLWRNPSNPKNRAYYCPKHIIGIERFYKAFDEFYQLTKIIKNSPL